MKTELRPMFCKALGVLSLLLHFEAMAANSIQEGEQDSCDGDECGTLGHSYLQIRVKPSRSAGFVEEEDEDNGEPWQKPDASSETFGASFAQAGMKRERTTHPVEEAEEEEDGIADSYEKNMETMGLSL